MNVHQVKLQTSSFTPDLLDGNEGPAAFRKAAIFPLTIITALRWWFNLCACCPSPILLPWEALDFAALLRIKHAWGRLAAFQWNDLAALVHHSQDAYNINITSCLTYTYTHTRFSQ